MATAQTLNEDSTARTKGIELREYGTVIIYGRVFTGVPKGDAEGYEDGPLALGSPMRGTWGIPDDRPSRHIDGPRVLSTKRRQARGSGQDELLVTFLSLVLPKAFVHNAYNETRRNVPVARDAFTVVTTTWGITADVNYVTVPSPGDYLDDQDGSTLSPICTAPVTFDHTSFPGRILVRAEWVSRVRPAPVLGASDVS